MIPGLLTTHYVYERMHAVLAANAHRPEGPNIGRQGQNLTISFLSLNRSSLSIRLLRSIDRHLPDFRGEVLIVDNGSSIEELQALRIVCNQIRPRCRIVELGANHGVAGGRNRTMPHLRTEWVMCLDNDIYFVSNPLQAVQNELAVLGCHFLNLPLLDSDARTIFSRGGHLYTHVHDGAVGCGGGSAYRQVACEEDRSPPAFLSTFLLGGASILNKETFQAAGCYDEAMFIGFEDIDFSIRLLRAGYKVGNSSAVSLVHDHPAPEKTTDADYERQRFSRQILHDAARHLEEKYGLAIWNAGVDAWLRQRHRELGFALEPLAEESAEEAAGATLPAEAKERPRIALIVDVEGWAFWNISQQLCRHLGDRYEFRLIESTVVDNLARLFLMTRDCEVVHFFWREYLNLLQTPYWSSYINHLGIGLPGFMEQVVRPRVISTCIYDHLHLDPEELAARAPMYRQLVDIYYVGSNRLYTIYANAGGYPRPAAVLEDGVDLGLFAPADLERFDSIADRNVVIGWAGNSRWSGLPVDYKGVRTILRPAINQLRQEGVPVRPLFADRAESGLIPHREMVNYYRKIDVYVCTSLIEGTPNPVLESMACGVPVITTDVGVVRDVFGPRQKEYILQERTIDCLKESLRRLIGRPEQFRELSAESLRQIQDWDWSFKARKFDAYFQQCLALRADRCTATA